MEVVKPLFSTRSVVSLVQDFSFVILIGSSVQLAVYSGGHLTSYWGGGQTSKYQDNIETDDRFKCHNAIKFIVKKVSHCYFSGTALQTFSLRLLGGATTPFAPRSVRHWLDIHLMCVCEETNGMTGAMTCRFFAQC